MGPGRTEGLGPTAAAVLVTLVVAVAVSAMVSIGGGPNQPLVADTHTAPAHVAMSHTGQHQG